MRLPINCLAGLFLGGLAHVLLYPHAPGFDFFALKYLLVQTGGLLGIVAFAPVCVFIAKKRQRDVLEAAFASGIALGLGGLAGAYWFASSGRPHAIIEVGVPISFLLAMFLPVKAPRPSMLRCLAVANLALFVLFLLPVGRTQIESNQQYDITLAPSLPEAASEFTGESSRPDVLLISVDTLRADVLDEIELPALSKLRGQSLSAPYALAPSSATLPSHISMVTGESPLQHTAYTNFGKLDEGIPTLAEAFSAGGFRTIATAANGLLNTDTGFDRGFELLVNVEGDAAHDKKTGVLSVALTGRRMVWYAAPLPDLWSQRLSVFLFMRRYSGLDISQEGAVATAPIVRELALSYLDQLYADETPFFYFLHFMDPHLPYHATDNYLGKLNGDRPLPDSYSNHTSGSLLLCRSAIAKVKEGGSASEIADARNVIDIQRDRYHEEMLMVDDALAQVFARIEQSGRPTVILFTSDHGEHFGENDLMLHGDLLHAANVRVPFILSTPNSSSADSLEVVPTLEDIPITLLRAAGFAIKDFGNGRDLMSDNVDEEPFASLSDKYLAVQHGDYKLICEWKSSDGPTSAIKPIQLYSQVNDGLDEAINLLGQAATMKEQQALFERAQLFVAECSKKGMRDFDEQDVADLNALGYALDDDAEATD